MSKYNFNGNKGGQAGTTNYANIMGVDASSLSTGILPYQKWDDLVNSMSFVHTNVWGGGTSYEETTFSSLADPSARPSYADYSDHDDDYAVGAYATEWSVYRSTHPFHLSQLPLHTAIDTMLYAFLPICGPSDVNPPGQLALCTVNDCSIAPTENVANPYFALQQACDGLDDGTIVIHDPWAAFWAGTTSFPGGTFQSLAFAKQEYKDNIKIVPSIGGWSLSKMFFHLHEQEQLDKFIYSAVNILTAWPFFDGLDIDWEFPGGLGADDGSEITLHKSALNGLRENAMSSYNKDQYACTDFGNDECAGDNGCGLPLYASYAVLGWCHPGFEDAGVDSYTVQKEGCSRKLAKEDPDCVSCDGYVHYQLFTQLFRKMNELDQSGRPTEFTSTKPAYFLSTAISSAPDKINEADYGRLVKEGSLDHIYLMSYDYMGAWGPVGHQTNLYDNTAFAQSGFSVVSGVQTLIDQGVPNEKIHVGVGTYGRGWKLTYTQNIAQDNDAILADVIANSQNVAGGCVGDIEEGVVDYETVVYKTSNGGNMKLVWDQCALAHLAVGENEIYTSDTIDSVIAKGKFVQENKLGGLFTWEVSQDSYSDYPLINVMNEALGRQPIGGSAKDGTNFTYASNLSDSSCYQALTAPASQSPAPNVDDIFCEGTSQGGEGGENDPPIQPPPGNAGTLDNKCNLIKEPGTVINCKDYEPFEANQEWVDWCITLWPNNVTNCDIDPVNCQWPETCAEAKANFIRLNEHGCDCAMTD